jgi:hypothetical protein
MSPSDYDVQSATASHFDRVWFGSMLYLGFEVTLCLSSFHTPFFFKDDVLLFLHLAANGAFTLRMRWNMNLKTLCCLRALLFYSCCV